MSPKRDLIMACRRWRLAGGMALFTLVACGGEKTPGATATGGTLVVATGAEAETLLPQLITSVAAKQIVDQIFEPLAEIGDGLNTLGDRGFVPRLASRWEWASDSLSVAFSLNPAARFHDGVPVRANDVVFSYRLTVDPAVQSVLAPNLTVVDSVTARDSLTAVVWFRRKDPERFFAATYNLPIVPEHLLKDIPRAELRTHAATRNPIGSGRFRFARWTPQATIEVIADTANYRGRPKLDRVVWSISADPTVLATRLLSAEADFLEVLRGDALTRMAGSTVARVVEFPSLSIGFLALNLNAPKSRAPHPILGNREFRRAFARLIDRSTIVKNVFDTTARLANGHFSAAIFQDSTLSALPFDEAGAQRTLDSLGWRDTNGDGIRDRMGKPLRLSLIVPTSSTVRQRIAILLQEQCKRAGIQLDVDAIEVKSFGERVSTHDYDLNLLALGLDPSPSTVSQIWGTGAIASGANSSNYSSRTFDAFADSAAGANDPARRQALYRAVFQTLIDDAPAVWLYELRNLVGINRRLRPGAMRADAWWAHLDEWSVTPGQEIERDRIGLAPPKS